MSEFIDLKIRLERRLEADLRLFFRDYLLAHARSGGFMSSATWTRTLTALLLSHYAKVVLSVHAGKLVSAPAEPLAVLREEGLAHQAELAARQAQLILSSIDREILASDQTKSLQVKKKPFTVFLSASLKSVWEKIKKRIPTIANVNTQGVAEEANKPPIEIVRDAQAETIVKTWITVQDARVRHNHAMAHGQRVRVDEPFNVGGEALMFPGDMSMGATLNNVINCRCTAQYGVERDGEFTPFGLGTRQGTARGTRRPGEPIGHREPKRPTSHFTFGASKTGVWRGQILLRNGERASYTLRNGGLTIRVGRNVVASSQVKRDAFGKWTLGRTTLDPRYHGLGIEEMLSRSIEATNRLR